MFHPLKINLQKADDVDQLLFEASMQHDASTAPSVQTPPLPDPVPVVIPDQPVSRPPVSVPAVITDQSVSNPPVSVAPQNPPPLPGNFDYYSVVHFNSYLLHSLHSIECFKPWWRWLWWLPIRCSFLWKILWSCKAPTAVQKTSSSVTAWCSTYNRADSLCSLSQECDRQNVQAGSQCRQVVCQLPKCEQPAWTGWSLQQDVLPLVVLKVISFVMLTSISLSFIK